MPAIELRCSAQTRLHWYVSVFDVYATPHLCPHCTQRVPLMPFEPRATTAGSEGFAGTPQFVQLSFRGTPVRGDPTLATSPPATRGCVHRPRVRTSDQVARFSTRSPTSAIFFLQLDDLKQLKDYGIVDGSVIAHVNAAQAAVGDAGVTVGPSPNDGAVDYAAIAELLAQAHRSSLAGRVHDPSDYVVDHTGEASQDWPKKWTQDHAYLAFPPVLVGNGGLLPREDVLEWDDGAAGAHITEADVEAALRALGSALEEAELSSTANANAAEGTAAGSGAAEAPEGGGSAHASSAKQATSQARSTPASSNTPHDVARAAQRAELRAALVRLRHARRARQALISRAPGRLVAFDEATAAANSGTSAESAWARLHVPPPTRTFRSLYVAQVSGRHRLRGTCVLRTAPITTIDARPP